MADIFFSYKREDRAQVEPFVRLLEGLGYSVWWDWQITVGERFDNVISKQLAIAGCVIVGWSQASVDAFWVKDEAAFGRDHNKLIPVSLDGVDPPLGFRQFHTAKFEGWDGSADDPRVQSLLSGIERICGPKERTQQAQVAPLSQPIPPVPEAPPPTVASEPSPRPAALEPSPPLTSGSATENSPPPVSISGRLVRIATARKWLTLLILLGLAAASLAAIRGAVLLDVFKLFSNETKPVLSCAGGMRLSAAGTVCERIVCERGQKMNAAGTDCEAIACVRATRLNEAGNGCESIICTRGFRLSAAGADCEQVVCRPGTRLNVLGDDCEVIVCDPGERLDQAGTGCEPIVCERGTRLNAARRGCQTIACSYGSRLNAAGNDCQGISCDPGTQLDRQGTGCEPIVCERGTRLSAAKRECESIVCGYGSRLNAVGNDCEPIMCATGTRLNPAGTACDQIICVWGQKRNAAGTGCDAIACGRGMKLNAQGTGCEPIPPAPTPPPVLEQKKAPPVVEQKKVPLTTKGNCTSLQARCAVKIGGECDPATGNWFYGSYGNRRAGGTIQAFNDCISRGGR